MVENGAMTEAPSSLTYYSIIFRNIVCLDLLLAGLNDLGIMACDVVNAYLNATC